MQLRNLKKDVFSAFLILAVIVGSFSIWGSTKTFAQDNLPVLRQIRVMEADQTGVNQPMGLAFSTRLNDFYTVDAKEWRQSSSFTDLVEVTTFEDRAGSARVAAAIEDPINMAYDNKADRLLVLQAKANQLLEIRADSSGKPDSATLTRHNVKYFNVQEPQGLTLDPVTGDLFILDGAGPRVIHVALGPGGNLEEGTPSILDLQTSGITTPRGIAFDPSTGNLHIVSPAEQKLYELTQNGEILAVRDLSAFDLRNPQGIVFAPSGDQTDDPSQLSLYLADAGTPELSAQNNARTGQASQSSGQIVELSLLAAAGLPAGTTIQQTTLIHIIDTSKAAWNPSAPDPAGIDYWPSTGKLLISDSEVEEMSNYYKGKNVYQSTLSGTLVSTCVTTSFSNEPTGVGINRNNNHIFFSDDSSTNDKIFEVTLGGDGTYCTSDDTVTINQVGNLYGIHDAEDVAYGNNTIFVAGGIDAEVYRIPLGANGVMGGGDDGPMTHFDTNSIGFSDLEGLGYNWDNGTLLLVSAPGTEKYLAETTTTGTLLNVYDLSYSGLRHKEDITFAPNSQNPAVKNFYITDRGIDNNSDSSENDGKVWEISISGPSNPTPTPTPSGTDLIFADGFESGDLLAWSARTTDSGDLSVTSGAALKGNRGMQAVLDDNNPIFVTDNTPSAEPHYRARFYFDPNSISMVSGDAHYIFNGFMGTSTAVMRLEFRQSSGNYQLRARLLNDGAAWISTNWFTISDAVHFFEVDWRAASSAGANDGGLTLWIDGVQQANLSGVDNDTTRIDLVKLGAVAGVDTGTRGTYYFDAFESRRQTYIGP